MQKEAILEIHQKNMQKLFLKSSILMQSLLLHIWDHDSVSPFLSFKNKWTILLALTSNEGANDFQFNYLAER